MLRGKSSRSHGPTNVQEAGGYYAASGFEQPQPSLYAHQALTSTRNQTHAYSSSSTSIQDPSFLGLLYTVYYAAAVSIMDSPHPPALGENVSAFDLVASFRHEVATRVLSLNENTSRYESISIIQAILLALMAEPKAFELHFKWLHLGAAIRTAQGLGLHRDGSQFDLRPVDIEVRRRVWAQLCVLDVRYAEQLGREPTITSYSYDTALPLSIDDTDLTEIQEQHAAAGHGRPSRFKAHQEIEQAQARHSPFSPMTLLMVEAEFARLFAHLLTVPYRARDSIFNTGVTTSQSSRKSHGSSERASRDQAVEKIEYRLQTFYGLNHRESTNPMQLFVFEIVDFHLARARFVVNMLDWKENYSLMSPIRRQSETMLLFNEAIAISSRCLQFIQQFSSSPYGWFTKRIRDVHSSAFVSLILASGYQVNTELANNAWTVLDQLFPIDTRTGTLLQKGLSKTFFGKVLCKARLRRDIFRGQAMQTAAGAAHHPYSAAMTVHTTTPLPTTVGANVSFPTSGNLFEDFDALMQDPLWSPGLASMENPYGPWEQPWNP
ncbi:hypothetical protein K491DRAFT_276236 [Lophiostoma macrostomum CBS 122681]|uniref:Xylanolytic transcriptional activator regulatory domain-containing protein n=1 Tax=Lophiostoma macrostomum CBS 122681 TaxID=1314788 RepID=A0A6A6THC0_9PLEO|nr:hypothetical protein K491DRAFT_276236 [Lophiostoma macrostomum CBS 122681]